MADDPAFDEIVRRLHGLPLTDFVAGRNAESAALKRTGDTTLAGRVKALRKPSAGADLTNRLSRGDAWLLEEIGDVGSRLRAAQTGSDAATLRALDGERRDVLARSVAAARSLAERDGGRATEASLRDVEQTVWAALVDAAAFAALRGGALVRGLSPSGFGAVDLTDASTLPLDVDTAAADEAVDGTPPTDDRARASKLRQARRDQEAAESALLTAEQEVDEAARREDEARRELSDLDDELEDLRERIESALEAKKIARSALDQHRAAARDAQKAQRAAASEAQRARRRTDSI